MRIIKNVILIFMLIICIILNSRIWFDVSLGIFDDVSTANSDKKEYDKSIWTILKPSKYIINLDGDFYSYTDDLDYKIWEQIIPNFEIILNSFSECSIGIEDKDYVIDNSIVMEFDSNISTDIFYDKFDINRDKNTRNIKKIKKIGVCLNDKHTIYINNGFLTYVINTYKVDNSSLIQYINNYIVDKSKVCRYETLDGNKDVSIIIPKLTYMYNPVSVTSEILNSKNNYVEKMAKQFFKKEFSYVRRSDEINGNISFVYKNKVVLNITPEGNLNFFDAVIDNQNNVNVYDSLITAINFSNNIFEISENLYLSSFTNIQYEGNFGYKFIFKYRVYNSEILYSDGIQALEIDVVSNKVMSYKRFIRKVDEQYIEKINVNKLLSPKDIIEMHKITEDNHIDLPICLDEEMISKINKVYLAYYDRVKINNSQQLCIAWVIEIDNKKYAFNALTGKLLEMI